VEGLMSFLLAARCIDDRVKMLKHTLFVILLGFTCGSGFAQETGALGAPDPPSLGFDDGDGQSGTEKAESSDDEPRARGSFDSMLKDFEKRVDKSEKDFKRLAKAQEERWKKLDKQLEESSEKVEEKFEKQDESWEKQTELWDEQEETNSSISKALKKAVVSGTSGTKSMKIVGRVHADYWGYPRATDGINLLETGDPNVSPQDRIGFRRMRFGVRGDVNDLMEYRIEMEFAGGNASEFRDAWLGFKEVGWVGKVLIGNQKRPYGLDHLNSSRHNVFLERPFVIESFNQDARRLGICAYNNTEDLAWNWRYGVYNQHLMQNSGQYISDHMQGEIAGRIANTAWYDETSGGRGYAHWAVSGTVAWPDGTGGPFESNEARFRHRPEARSINRWLNTDRIDGADTYELLGLEGVVNLGSLQMVAEYQTIFMQRDAGFDDVTLHGGYVYLSYFLTGEHMPWKRTSGTIDRVKPFENFFLLKGCDGCTVRGKGAWQIAARYSYADFNDADVLGGVGNSVTLGLNWLWNPNARMQFNYIFGDVQDVGVDGVPTSGDYQIVGTRVMIDF
jgi:phosphate-selective porin OprO/OprP